MKSVKIMMLTLLGLVIFSCQTDDNSKVNIPIESLTKVSPLSSLVSRVSQNPTAIDNIIDGTSFCSVKLPVTLYVDYNKVEISSRSDFQLVSSIKEEFANDDDKINFVYPITMVLKNFSQINLNNEEQLNSLIDSYGSYNDFYEIDCIDFNYPIVINSYDTNSQIAKSFTFQTNSQLFNFIANLNETDIFSFVFPITMTSSVNNQTVTINNNSDLSTAIEEVVNLCEIPVGGDTNIDLPYTIVYGTWHISYLLDNTEDKTAEFYGYNFTFLSNGTVKAIKGNYIINGAWSTYTNNGIDKLTFNFEGNALDELKENWHVLEFNSNLIRLKDTTNDTHYLYFAKN